MQAIILSDIHANFEALKQFEEAIAAADLRICLGDLVGYYCQVNEVVEFVRRYNFLCVRGNHDDFLVTGCPADAADSVRFGIEYAERVLDPDHRRWLTSLPLLWGGFLAGAGGNRHAALLCHGSPWKPLTDYLYLDSPLLPQMNQFSFDLIAFGQTHRPILIERESKLFLNPGSVGQSRHRPGVACAALAEVSSRLSISLIEIPYDTEPVVTRAVRAGAGDWVGKHLRST